MGKGAWDFLTIITREISSRLLAVSKEGCSSSSSLEAMGLQNWQYKLVFISTMEMM